jgi:hypothetical protein
MSDSIDLGPEAWRIRALAKSVSDILRQKYEPQEYYSEEQVEAACDECQAPPSVRQYAVAMFVEPAEADGVLQKLGSSKTAHELRKFLASQVFLISGPDVSSGALINRFHAAGDPGGGAGDWTAGDWADGGCDGGGNGGGDGGGD